MATIYDEYTNKDELLAAVAAAITEGKNENGDQTFRLVNADAETWRAKFDKEAKDHKSERNKRQELESRFSELSKQREADAAELEKLRNMQPDNMRETMERYAVDLAALKKERDELTSRLTPLQDQVKRFQEMQTRARIENELVEAAQKLNVVVSAYRDVKRLATQFHVNDNDVVVDANGALVMEVLGKEIELSPHWLKRSQGGGSASGVGGAVSDEAKFKQALATNNVRDMFAYAPRTPVKR